MASPAPLPEKGQQVWFDHPEESWMEGTINIIDQKKKCVSVKPKRGGQEVTVSTDSVHPFREQNVNAESLSDLLNLVELHESSLLEAVKKRFEKDLCCTNIGPLILSLNPFKWTIPHYQPDRMKDYIAQRRNLVPTVWSVADKAFRQLKEGHGSQSIIVTGESGAGKTEAVKSVIKYIGGLSCSMIDDPKAHDVAEVIADKVAESSPILEAFGNAKTLNNDNSSRFGKFIRLQFDNRGTLLGADTINYLLEKSRIVTQGPGERSFHIFYQLLAGASAAEKQELFLNSASEFKAITQGNCMTIDGVNDANEYKEVRKAMDIVGISKEEQQEVFAVVASILHLQNIEFISVEDVAKVKNMDAVEKAAKLLKIDKDALEKALVTKTVIIVNKPIVSRLQPDKAKDARDAFSKALYSNLFNWIVKKINERIAVQEGADHFVGLLDIFGFEKFETNSFEQFCINFANETLQAHYNHYTFKQDSQECENEGVDVTSVNFNDNQGCLALFYKTGGILAYLEEQCRLGNKNTTDKNFHAIIKENCATNKYFKADPLRPDEFIVHHYAASIPYSVNGWIEKNKDALKEDLIELIQTSSSLFVKALLSKPDPKSKQVTVGGSFKEQLNNLVQVFNTTTPHWIRCIKPHKAKKPGMFHSKDVMTQLKSSGVLETIRIRKEGYSVRIPLHEFWGKYRVLIGGGPKIENYSAGCKMILEHVKFDKVKAQVGTHRVFLRNYAYNELEDIKGRQLLDNIKTIQRVARGFVARLLKKKLLAIKQAEKERLEQERRRAELERIEQERLERERREAERRAAEEAERRRLEEIKRREEMRLKREKEEREQLEKFKREREEIERKRLEEIRRQQEERQQEIARLEWEKREKERIEQERIAMEKMRLEREKMEAERKAAEERRLEILRMEEEHAAAVRREKEMQRLEAIERRKSEKQKIMVENENRKRKVLQKLELEKLEKEEMEKEAKRIKRETELQFELEKKAWEEVEYHRLQQMLYEEQRKREQKFEKQVLKQRQVINKQRIKEQIAEEKASVIQEKLAKSQLRLTTLKIQKEEEIQQKIEEEQKKLEEVKKAKQEEEIQAMRRKIIYQLEQEKAAKRESMKQQILKKMRDESIKQQWRIAELKKKELEQEEVLHRRRNEQEIERAKHEDQLRKEQQAIEYSLKQKLSIGTPKLSPSAKEIPVERIYTGLFAEAEKMKTPRTSTSSPSASPRMSTARTPRDLPSRPSSSMSGNFSLSHLQGKLPAHLSPRGHFSLRKH